MRWVCWPAAVVLMSLVPGSWLPRARADEQAGSRRPALQPTAFRPLPLGRIKPAGWLREQLKTQAAGLSGHLDEFWPDIKDSAWTGGKAEGWERVPYWLDGLVPLAYLVDDPSLQAKVKRFVDHILDHQQADGWLGPIGDAGGHQPYDVWPLFPLFQALTQYAVFSMLDLLDKHHGQATGIFTCDEHLAGRSTSQGTELCTVVEAMYSLEALSAVTGDARLGDRLEKLAFNALPATFKNICKYIEMIVRGHRKKRGTREEKGDITEWH